MSDEPKKRSRAGIGWTLVVILLLAYPLSMPPVLRWAFNRGDLPLASLQLLQTGNVGREFTRAQERDELVFVPLGYGMGSG